MAVVFYLAWVAEGTAFNASIHATTATKIWDGTEGDEKVFSFQLEHAEGEFPSLTAELINPRVGLLSAGRNQWIWLSADDNGGGAEAIFAGRIVGVPEDLTNEVVRVQFVARSSDYIAQKAAVAASLDVLPWVDRVWIQEGADDPDTVLEAYPLRYHIDRTTLVVSASDINDGEDGTIEVGEDDHYYDNFGVSYSDPPLRSISISGTVSWAQQGSGDVDLTRMLCQKFIDVGSPYPEPFVTSLTGEGLLSSWPAPEDNIGGGWIVASSSSIIEATWIQPKSYVVRYGDRADNTVTPHSTAVTTIDLLLGTGTEPPPATVFSGSPAVSASITDSGTDPFGNWEAAFPLGAYMINFVVHFDANRDRSETVLATVEADVQPLLTDPGAAETDTIELSSTFAAEPVDTTGSPPTATLPIEDLRRNSYFKTDRGAQSFEYLVLLARAKLLSRARAVEINFDVPWTVGKGVSCRKNVHLVDNRLPGGQGTGKIIAYQLVADGENIGGNLTIGCSIGYGVALSGPAAGTPNYVEDGYVEDGYQQRTGSEVELLTGEIQYESFDDFEITDDDGVDLFNMTAATVVNSLTVDGGVFQQTAAVDAEAAKPPTAMPDPVAALKNIPTVITLDLVPVEGGAFHVDYNMSVSQLVVPQGIDLEAA